MALFDNGLKIGTGLAIGLGIIILAPAIAPAVAAVVRPVAKASIKSGVILFEKARELITEAMESVEDLAAGSSCGTRSGKTAADLYAGFRRHGWRRCLLMRSVLTAPRKGAV